MTKILITNEKKLKEKHKKDHELYEYKQYQVTPRSDFAQAFVSFYEIPPKKYSYPYHYHMNNTEVFYIIEGNGIIETKEGKFLVKEGDVIVCPPKEEGGHRLYNSGDINLKYLDVDTTNSPDIIKYPHSNKVGVIIHNQSSDFYFDDKVDYYEGE